MNCAPHSVGFWLESARKLVHVGQSELAKTYLRHQLSVPATAAPAPTATEAATTTTTETPAAFDGVVLAIEAIAGWNCGAFGAWLAYWEPGQADDDLVFDRSVMNSNERIAVTAPCERVSDPPDPVVVTCPIFVEDDFHGAGGLTSNGIMKFHLNGDGLIVNTSKSTYGDKNGNCCREWQDFHAAFHRWLRDAHPDVYEETGPSAGTPRWYLPGVATGNADHMLVALEYVDEFVAQPGDGYPLAG